MFSVLVLLLLLPSVVVAVVRLLLKDQDQGWVSTQLD
jgi:hypothetical protein